MYAIIITRLLQKQHTILVSVYRYILPYNIVQISHSMYLKTQTNHNIESPHEQQGLQSAELDWSLKLLICVVYVSCFHLTFKKGNHFNLKLSISVKPFQVTSKMLSNGHIRSQVKSTFIPKQRPRRWDGLPDHW